MIPENQAVILILSNFIMSPERLASDSSMIGMFAALEKERDAPSQPSTPANYSRKKQKWLLHLKTLATLAPKGGCNAKRPMQWLLNLVNQSIQIVQLNRVVQLTHPC